MIEQLRPWMKDPVIIGLMGFWIVCWIGGLIDAKDHPKVWMFILMMGIAWYTFYLFLLVS